MKRITVQVNQVGLVVKNNAVMRVLATGKYWLGFGEHVEIHPLSGPVQTAHDMDVLLQVAGFREMVDVVEIPDHALCLVYVNNNFDRVLSAGRHVFWKGLADYRFQIEDISSITIAPTIDRPLLDRLVLANCVRCFKLEPSEKGLLFVDGKYVQTLEARTYYWWKNAVTLSVSKADLRITAMEIPGQEILTRDKVQIRVNFSVNYQVTDIVKALLENKEYEKQLYTLMQLVLRQYIGQMTLDELMESKAEIAKYVIDTTVSEAAALGLTLHNGGVKDIILPGEVREIMNQVLIAEKRAQANIITRREETASTRSLLNTAKLMEENTMLFKLKEMEYVEKIAEKINTISVSGNGQIVDQLKQLFVK
ncbi:slipin family protein [Sphingobacterium alkalisoli]|uniref:Slipin family protein n=1 Tax=Sphingobacterium alkalisoli TaxID=1874115 RepID=A0A4U0H1H6_9SPHI|nr:slipin family protein [Sphingobacterium alkalisoli]TJY65410.1 slipin family protein [Sphingobacterium alkalisoli]GGH20619.1 peptidase [Sphingobacterium alkalisoli]